MKVKSNLKNLKRLKTYPDKFIEAMNEEGKEVFDKSQELVPVETGELKNSGYYTKMNKENRLCIVGYSAPYAAKIHEGTVAGNNAGFKFLTRAADATKPGRARRIKQKLQ